MSSPLGFIRDKFNTGVMAVTSLVLPFLPFAAHAAPPAPPADQTELAANNNTSEVTPTATRRAGDYSAQYKVVGIAVLKGTKDEINPKTGKPMTGEEIGELYAKRFRTKFETPAKVFSESYEGDYTSIGFLIKNELYGYYDVEQALVAMGLIANDFQGAWWEPPTGKSQPVSSVVLGPNPNN